MHRKPLFLAAALAALLGATAQAQTLSVYHSPDDSGVDPGAPVSVPLGPSTVSLNLWFDTGPGSVPPVGAPCLDALDGSEVCGLDVLLQANGDVSFQTSPSDGFVPDPSADVVWNTTASTWSGNFGDPLNGEVGQHRFGTLTVIVGAAGGTVDVMGKAYVDSGLALQTIGQKTILQASANDFDGDGTPDASDPCPSIFDDGTDTDGDLVPDACDICSSVANPVVASPQPWMTLVSGQRDDDGDGTGNACDADFDQAGAVVGGTDLGLQRAAFNQDVSSPTACGGGPCDIFDMDEVGALIGGTDLTLGRSAFNTQPGPSCLAAGAADVDADGIADPCDPNPLGPSGTGAPGYFSAPAALTLDRAVCSGDSCP